MTQDNEERKHLIWANWQFLWKLSNPGVFVYMAVNLIRSLSLYFPQHSVFYLHVLFHFLFSMLQIFSCSALRSLHRTSIFLYHFLHSFCRSVYLLLKYTPEKIPAPSKVFFLVNLFFLPLYLTPILSFVIYTLLFTCVTQ